MLIQGLDTNSCYYVMSIAFNYRSLCDTQRDAILTCVQKAQVDNTCLDWTGGVVPPAARLCLHNNTDVAYYNFDARRPISTIFGTVVAETVCYQAIILFSTSPD